MEESAFGAFTSTEIVLATIPMNSGSLRQWKYQLFCAAALVTVKLCWLQFKVQDAELRHTNIYFQSKAMHST
jgi:hypothetical protein